MTVKAPFAIDQTRVQVLEAGTGAKALADGYVTVHYYGVNGRTGKMFEESYTDGTGVTFSLAQVVAGFKTGLTGQQSGNRVLIAMPGTDAYDASRPAARGLRGRRHPDLRGRHDLGLGGRAVRATTCRPVCPP